MTLQTYIVSYWGRQKHFATVSGTAADLSETGEVEHSAMDRMLGQAHRRLEARLPPKQAC